MTSYIHSGNFENINDFIQASFGTHTRLANATSYNYVDEAKSFGIANSKNPFAIGTNALPTGSGATFNNWHWAVSKNQKTMMLWAQTADPLTAGYYAVSAVLAQDLSGIWHVFYYNTKAGSDFFTDRIVPIELLLQYSRHRQNNHEHIADRRLGRSAKYSKSLLQH